MQFQDPSLNYSPDSVSVEGISKSVHDLTIPEFLDNWHDSWAYTLIVLHPEYCYYQTFCEQMSESNNYDMSFMQCETSQQATDNGFFNPMNNYNNSVTSISLPSNSTDPICNSPSCSFCSGICSSIQDSLINFTDTNTVAENTPDTISIWEFIYSLRNYSSYSYSPNDFDNSEWKMFRGMYISLKQHFINNFANTLSNCPYPDINFENDTVHQQRFILDPESAINNIITNSDTNLSGYEHNPEQITAVISEHCSQTCLNYANTWMENLKLCHFLSSDSIILRQELIDICTNGCAPNNPMGASSASVPSSNGNYSFEQALQWFTDSLPQYSLSDSCNSFLINMPLNQGHNYFGYTIPDTCTCNLVALNETDFQNCLANDSLPKSIFSEQDLFEYTYNETIDLNALKCWCDSNKCNSLFNDCNYIFDTSSTSIQNDISDFFNNYFPDTSDNNYYILNNNDTSIKFIHFISPANPNCYYDLSIPKHNLYPNTQINSVSDFSISYNNTQHYYDISFNINNDIEILRSKLFCSECTTSINPPVVPAKLTCNYCLNCDKTEQYYDTFITTYPNIVDTQNIAQTIRLFTVYLSNNTGTNLTPAEISQFLFHTCPENTEAELCPEIQDSCQCADYLIHSSQDYANYLWEEYLDSLSLDFQKKYIAYCLNIINETFTMQYNNNEYHYTLYYFDQAGNKIKTVPPQGIHLLDNTEIQQSIAYRNGQSSTPVYPNHSLTTKNKYNSLDQPIWQKTPDANEQRFWYDKLGRIIATQNAEQSKNRYFSHYNLYGYTFNYQKYDYISRIIEKGEVLFNSPLTEQQLGTLNFPDNLTNNKKLDFVKIYYNNAPYSVYGFEQKNLRNRIATIEKKVRLYKSSNPSILLSDHTVVCKTFFNYDIAGNVKSVLKDNPNLSGFHNRFQKTDYKYDLISGNVNYVMYQKGKPDQFYHKYQYDADNRITQVYTSKDSVLWKKNANYFYYLHGPLARTELGQHKVQGIDYAYTLQGWVKGINSTILDPQKDIGRDGADGINKFIGKDVFSFSLNYFDGDYEAIGGNNDFLAGGLSLQGYDLFNGNIKSMATTITHPDTRKILSQASVYKYDQLNRITKAEILNSNNLLSTNNWNASTSDSSYNTEYTYDANGNIQTLKRNGTAENLEMDNLIYNYENGTNKLQYITDFVNSNVYETDIDKQDPGNYKYDKTGNLIQDVSEEIKDIKWTSTGKVREVIRTKHSIKPDLEFFYDANDNRIGKLIKPKNPENGLSDKKTWKYTFYSRDHSENIMATYNIQYNNDTNLYILSLKEQMLYGSDLLGVYNDSIVIGFSNYIKFNPDNHLEIIHNTLQMNELHVLDEQQSYLDTNYFATMHKYHGITGNIAYQLTNHLGNVHTTISDKPLLKDVTGDGLVDEKRAIILSSGDYYPGGFLMPGRNFSSNIYRFGYNAGSEKDDEITGITGSHFTTFFREGDTRLLTWWSPDPKPHASWSSYAYMNGNPIWFNDPLGDHGIKDFFKGMGNVLSGRPWKAKHSLKLGPVVKRKKEWAFMRHPGRGIVTESYLKQLKAKTERYRGGEEKLAWSERLMGRIQEDISHELSVKEPDDFTEPKTATTKFYVPKIPKTYQAEFEPTLLAGGLQVSVLRKDRTVYSATGFKTTDKMGKPLFKVRNSDEIQISLTRVQPAFGIGYGSSGVSVSTPGTLTEVRIIPSFSYHIRLQIKQ